MPSSNASTMEEKQPSNANKLNLLWLVFTVLVFSALVKLGLWQSDRALEKELRLAKIEQLNSQNPISLARLVKLISHSQSIDEVNDYPVILKGQFNKKQVFLLDNQTNKGRLGYRVYQVATTAKYAVLINLGWVNGSINRDELPDVKALDGWHQFQGNVRFIEAGIMLESQVFSDNTWPLRVQQIELDKFSSIINKQLLPFVVYVDKNESIGFEKNWQPIVMSPQKHRGYAFQWFSLALAWILLMIWAKFGSDIKKVMTKKNKKDNKLR
ncbi:SURF1 family protein [Colwellia sp. KU-HH00111]|uniref:SURF1 family protein n=1 Tax=Colwellia sp. KU-HH00111 TaxID=3127652 RepID=UPI003103331D